MIADGYKDTEVGVIPIEWDVVELDNIVEFKNGKGHEQVIDENGQYIVVNSKFISTNGNVYKSSNSNLSPLKSNDITLVMSDIPNGKALAKCFYINEDDRYTLNQRICSLTAIKDNPLYLFYRLNRNEYFLKFNDGVNQTNLRKNEVLECKIPLPPLKEQEKIAEILSTADDKIDAIQIQIDRAEKLKKGLLQKLLSEGIGHSEFKDSELGKIPKSWKVSKLEGLVNIVSGQSPSKFDLTGSEYKFFKVNQLNFCEKYLTNSEYAFDEEIDNLLDSGTIIFPKRGASIFTNKVRILTHKSFIDTNLMGLITKDNLNNIFLYYWLVEFELSNIADTSSIPQINNKHINPLKMPIPSLEEQKQIADILSTADEKLEVLRAKKEKYEILKKGLLQKLLSGEVRV